MNLSQRQLQAFLHVARLSSFTRAAELLHITQSGLSAMMRDLEAQLDCRLFDRTTRSVALTDAGQQLVPVAERVIAELESVSDSLRRISAQARRILTVGATPLVVSSVMPQVSQLFAARHPGIRLRLKDLSRDQIQEGVAEGSLDAGFGAFFEPASGIERIALAEFPLAFLSPLPTGAAARRPRPLPWEALRNESLIGLVAANPVQQLIESHLQAIGRAHEERPAYANFQSVLAMVEAGAGGAILPSFVAAASKRYRVRMAPLCRPRVCLAFYQITKKGRPGAEGMPELAQALTEVLRSESVPA